MNERISKAELARRLKVSRQQIGNYVAKGMPVLQDGSVPWPSSQQWVKDNIVPQRSGSYYARQRQKETENLSIENLQIPETRTVTRNGTPSVAPEVVDDPYSLGILHGSRHVRVMLRREMPRLLADARNLDTDQKVFIIALIDFLATSFGAPNEEPLPPILWDSFNLEPDSLSDYFTKSIAWLKGLPN